MHRATTDVYQMPLNILRQVGEIGGNGVMVASAAVVNPLTLAVFVRVSVNRCAKIRALPQIVQNHLGDDFISLVKRIAGEDF